MIVLWESARQIQPGFRVGILCSMINFMFWVLEKRKGNNVHLYEIQCNKLFKTFQEWVGRPITCFCFIMKAIMDNTKADNTQQKCHRFRQIPCVLKMPLNGTSNLITETKHPQVYHKMLQIQELFLSVSWVSTFNISTQFSLPLLFLSGKKTAYKSLALEMCRACLLM